MWPKILAALGYKILETIVMAIVSYITEKRTESKHKKEVSKKIKEIMADEKDPTIRARRIDNMLNS